MILFAKVEDIMAKNVIGGVHPGCSKNPQIAQILRDVSLDPSKKRENLESSQSKVTQLTSSPLEPQRAWGVSRPQAPDSWHSHPKSSRFLSTNTSQIVI